MQVTVKLYGVLRRSRPTGTGGAAHQPFILSLPEGATVANLVEMLEIDAHRFGVAAVNDQAVTAGAGLNDGDRVSLFPPAAGGQGLHVFIAGVMQGSRNDHLIDSQNYRQVITEALTAHVPGVKITDPFASNPDSVDYEFEVARKTFLTNTAKAADVDVLIAYLPVASMGTAIEMWTAYNARAYIIAVTPLEHNWVVKVTADEVLPDLKSLLTTIEDGRFVQAVTSKRTG